MQAERIIEQNIEMFSKTFTKKDTLSFQAKHTILGMIQMAVHLEALSFADAEKHINAMFEAYGALAS
jgi:hypothetical protein